jgi:hypothetical protein
MCANTVSSFNRNAIGQLLAKWLQATKKWSKLNKDRSTNDRLNVGIGLNA